MDNDTQENARALAATVSHCTPLGVMALAQATNAMMNKYDAMVAEGAEHDQAVRLAVLQAMEFTPDESGQNQAWRQTLTGALEVGLQIDQIVRGMLPQI